MLIYIILGLCRNVGVISIITIVLQSRWDQKPTPDSVTGTIYLLNISMGNVIQLEPYRTKRQQLKTLDNVFSFFGFIFDLFVQYVINPIIAVRETIRQKRIVVV